MKFEVVTLPPFTLCGISLPTDSKTELNLKTAKIPAFEQSYYEQNLAIKIPNRVSPGKTFCCYTSYNPDHFGNYTCFIGEEASNIDSPPAGFLLHQVPAQTYLKFKAPHGPWLKTVMDSWKKVVTLDLTALGYQLNHFTDFEIHDQRTASQKEGNVELYVGVKKL